MSKESSTQLRKDIQKLNRTKRTKPVVFLGGNCSDNSWREEIIRDYSKEFVFLDPYDKKWKAEDDIYDEVAGMVQADYVIFYKGGDQTKKELEFLKSIGRANDESIRRVDNMNDLRKILDSIVVLHGKNKLCVASILRKCASVLMLKEAKHGETYKYSSTQIDIPEHIAQEIMLWGKTNIPKKDLCTTGDAYGLEDEIHCTLLYGSMDIDPDKVLDFLKKVKPFEVRLGIINAFKDDKNHDVLKIDVESPMMEKLYYFFRENLKNENKFPTYHPHITIGYVKKGKADRFIGDEKFKGVTFNADAVTFSSKDNRKIKIPLLG